MRMLDGFGVIVGFIMAGCSTLSVAHRIEDVSVNSTYAINGSACRIEVVEIRTTRDIRNFNFDEVEEVCGKEFCEDDRLFAVRCLRFEYIRNLDQQVGW
jgi:hypothetical protein